MASSREGEFARTGGGDDPAAGLALSGVAGLGAGGEFDLIRSFFAGRSRLRVRGVRLGVGDDAAVVEGDGIVLSTDLSIEEIHFRRDWLEPEEVGYRAATAALSDLAAMAARPIGVLVSLAATPDDAPALAPAIMAGVRGLVESLGGEVLGGDLSRSPGPLVLDIVAVGESAEPVRRSGGRAGQELWVTGSLGGAAAAVEALLQGRTPRPPLLERFRRPVPRVLEAIWLVDRGLPRAMLDLSDGLAGDLSHLAAASGVAAVIDVAAIPIDEELASGATAGQARRLAMAGGEDYELLFAAEADSVEPHVAEFGAEFGIRLTRVGFLESGSGTFVQDGPGGTRAPLPVSGFRHFGGSA